MPSSAIVFTEVVAIAVCTELVAIVLFTSVWTATICADVA
jgi:hypothetical protein